MLIIGGLIAVAIVALALAFFLARGDNREKQAYELPPRTRETQPVAATPKPDPQVESAPATPTPTSRPAPAEYRRVDELEGASTNHDASTYYDQDTSVPALNRRVYELAGQLHSLQRQSQEIERSLIELSGTIEGMDTRGRHNSTPFYSGGSYVPGDSHEES
ncbi:hypothetical protein KDA_18140 [Dictyobacter alpinus]|uniref:Uncharacterized protein n=1 Tax=Dictyobacter alpinus TaxID=2014873 RepID=A0A402B4R7_9CHLR|nr:hypothetical protein [Dictyobacter alpinus]GCE26330.1 hypothetical protein KDA_18140 [Dictyobacter alpinus]